MTRAAAPTRAPLPRAGVLSAALAALLAAGAGAQPPAPRPLSPAGTEALRFLLKKEGIEPLRRISDLPRGVSRTMVIILGDTTGLKGTKSWPLHFGPFLSSGGSILIATDRPLAFVDDMNPLDRSSDFLRIPGTLLESTDPRACYRGLSFCPFVSPDLGEHAGDQRFEPFRPLFDSLTSVATNNPSHIEMVKPGAFIPLAAFPPSAREVGTRHRAGHFAAGTTEGRGRLLVLADHSVFINEMILQPDNDNFDFALNCINWLRQNNADGQPPRDRCLFIEDSWIVTNFDVELPTPPPPPLPPLNVLANAIFQHGNRVVAELQDRDWFNQRLLRRVPTWRLLRTVMVVVTLAVLFLVAHRLWAARTRPDPLHPTGPTDDLAPRGGGAEERLAALAAAGNLAEAARAQVRAWFAGFGVSPPAPAAEGFRPVPPPPVRADAPWPKRRRFRREVRSLWAFASGGGPERVTPRGWERMRERLLDLARAARDGEWHFTTATED